MIDPVAKIKKSLEQLALQRAELRMRARKQPEIAEGLTQALSHLDQAESHLEALRSQGAKLKKRQEARANKPAKKPRPPMPLPEGWPLSHQSIQAAAAALVQRARPASARPAAAAFSEGSDVHKMDSSMWKAADHHHEEEAEDDSVIRPPKDQSKPPRRFNDSSITGWKIDEDSD